jgi:hypothetical protein
MYTNAQYVNNPLGQISSIRVSIDGIISCVPIDPNNKDYENIMQLVSSGVLTIAPAGIT